APRSPGSPACAAAAPGISRDGPNFPHREPARRTAVRAAACRGGAEGGWGCVGRSAPPGAVLHLWSSRALGAVGLVVEPAGVSARVRCGDDQSRTADGNPASVLCRALE